jgi:hypothetical protein
MKNSGGNLAGCYSRLYPLRYLSIPKSACTTVKNLIYFIDNGAFYPDPVAIHADLGANLTGRLEDREAVRDAVSRCKICFTFVREPFARAYSAFSEKIFDPGPYSFPRYRRLITQQYGLRIPAGDEYYTADMHAENFRRFLAFVADNIAGRTSLPLNSHWAPQASLVDAALKFTNIDLIGRVERFREGMSYVLSVIGYSGALDLGVRFNEGPRPPFTLRDVLNDDVRRALLEVYEADLRRFNYR